MICKPINWIRECLEKANFHLRHGVATNESEYRNSTSHSVHEFTVLIDLLQKCLGKKSVITYCSYISSCQHGDSKNSAGSFCLVLLECQHCDNVHTIYCAADNLKNNNIPGFMCFQDIVCIFFWFLGLSTAPFESCVCSSSVWNHACFVLPCFIIHVVWSTLHSPTLHTFPPNPPKILSDQRSQTSITVGSELAVLRGRCR